MSEEAQRFPWNLPAEWLPELPINRPLLAERYHALLVVLREQQLTRASLKQQISKAMRADLSDLSMSERFLLHKALLEAFGFGSDGTSGSPVPRKPLPPTDSEGAET